MSEPDFFLMVVVVAVVSVVVVVAVPATSVKLRAGRNDMLASLVAMRIRASLEQEPFCRVHSSLVPNCAPAASSSQSDQRHDDTRSDVIVGYSLATAKISKTMNQGASE